MSSTVIFVHGLWMNGMEMGMLENRFKQSGYQTSRFRYKSTDISPKENADSLAEHIDSIDSDEIHFVCHSLGGLILRHCLNNQPLEKPGKIVMLGTPNKTSIAAREFSRWPMASSVLGKSVEQGLLGPLPAWQIDHELGIIAGDLRFELGLFIPNIPKPNDGTVAVIETELEGMHDHITLHVSHFGMLVSKKTFIQTKHFIEQACFAHDA